MKMAAIGFGLAMFGYGMIYYGLALITGQHRPFLYAMFHTGASPNSNSNQSPGMTGSNVAKNGANAPGFNF